MVAAASSTVCSSTRKPSRADETWLFRGTGPVGGLLAVEQRLRDGGADAARRVGAVNLGAHDLVGGRPRWLLTSVY